MTTKKAIGKNISAKTEAFCIRYVYFNRPLTKIKSSEKSTPIVDSSFHVYFAPVNMKRNEVFEFVSNATSKFSDDLGLEPNTFEVASTVDSFLAENGFKEVSSDELKDTNTTYLFFVNGKQENFKHSTLFSNYTKWYTPKRQNFLSRTLDF